MQLSRGAADPRTFWRGVFANGRMGLLQNVCEGCWSANSAESMARVRAGDTGGDWESNLSQTMLHNERVRFRMCSFNVCVKVWRNSVANGRRLEARGCKTSSKENPSSVLRSPRGPPQNRQGPTSLNARRPEHPYARKAWWALHTDHARS